MKRIYSASHHGEGTIYLYYLRDVLPAFGFALALTGLLFGGERLRKLFGFALIRFIGLISYSVYLWHLPMLNLCAKFPDAVASPLGQRFSFILVREFVATILLSTVLYCYRKTFFGTRSQTITVTYSLK